MLCRRTVPFGHCVACGAGLVLSAGGRVERGATPLRAVSSLGWEMPSAHPVCTLWCLPSECSDQTSRPLEAFGRRKGDVKAGSIFRLPKFWNNKLS